MRRIYFFVILSLLIFTLTCLSCSGEAVVNSTEISNQEESPLYPAIEPLRTGYLDVSDTHSLYWEVCGVEDGLPVIVLHGGPGGSASPDLRRYFDPAKFKVILFDQRGAGRSKPLAEWKENTTQLLVEDINALRDHLGVTGKAILFGGSWGSTLAVAYAETYPDLVSAMVLRGVFLATKSEIDFFYHGGSSAFFPKNYQLLQSIVPEPESKDYPRQLFEMTQSGDPELRKKAIDGWAYYEIRMVSLNMTDEFCRQIVNNNDMTPFSVLENYYMMNGCFLDDTQLLDNAGTIADIPTFIVNGRFDAICPPRTAAALADKLNDVKLKIVSAAHSSREPAITDALVKGVRWAAERSENK